MAADQRAGRTRTCNSTAECPDAVCWLLACISTAHDSSASGPQGTTTLQTSAALQGIRTTHQEFRYGDGAAGTRATEVFTSLQSGATGQDCNGHGTHVAAVVAGLTVGVAKNATLLSVRSLECMGNGTVSQVRKCLPGQLP